MEITHKKNPQKSNGVDQINSKSQAVMCNIPNYVKGTDFLEGVDDMGWVLFQRKS